MATKKQGRTGNGGETGGDAARPAIPPHNFPPSGGTDSGGNAETTGRFVVIFKEEADAASIRSALNNLAGLREVASTNDFEESAISGDALANEQAVLFPHLGIAVVANEDAIGALAAAESDAESSILAIEPEYLAYPSAAPTPALDLRYLQGYRDAVNHIYEQLSNGGTSEAEAEIAAMFADTAQFTWGLQATRVSTSSRSGLGIRVAVLDTGMDLDHPDFRGRPIKAKSFVIGVTPQDVNGHGTHCIGTACGPQRPASGVRRYGVAFGAQIFAGKVFNNAPRPTASTGAVLAGIEWAIDNGCRVASLSLGIRIDQKVLQYEAPVRRALQAGTLVVAAAGNNADRPHDPGFVEPPANADAAMAVAAVDARLRIASFSGRSSRVTGLGGIVNISAPGVAVFSSIPGGHRNLDGTSMATPHVAGIAALWAQATGESGQALWNRLLQTVRPLSLPAADTGAGLVQAPQ